jgi:hypothetical protein
LVYLKKDGTVGKAVQPTDATQLNATSASHANEEVIRTYHWREFGAGRADDFSRVNAVATNCAFTLDDGTTSLTGQNARGEAELFPENTNDFITFTFVGTGLDIIEGFDQSSVVATYNVLIDNVAILTSSTIYTGVKGRKVKIVSGLPYGTHTFKLLRTSSGTTGTIRGFVVYGPKKPVLPSGAIELADYYIMGNYTASTTETIDAPAAGSLRKMNTREFWYSQVWTAGSAQPINTAGGFSMSTSVLNGFVEYSFFGTGFEYRVNSEANQTQTVRLDGSITNYTAAGITNSFVGSGATWTPTAGTITGNGGVGSVLCISGLTLGWHTVRVTLTATTGGSLFFECLDIITPIHSPKTDLYGDVNSTLAIGNNAISDNRVVDPLLSAAPKRAWAQAVGISSSPSTTATIPVPVPDMSCVIKTSGNPIKISYSVCASLNASPTFVAYTVMLNGEFVGRTKYDMSSSINADHVVADSFIVPVAAGVHKIDLHWQVGSNQALGESIARNIMVEEISG